MTNPSLSPPIVLVVEDELIIALDLCETVQELGYSLVGPYPDKAQAFQAIEQRLPDAAILDVNIIDGEVFPLADVLAKNGVPIIFHSGHLPVEMVRQRYPGALACSKPCSPDRLVSALRQVVSRPPGQSGSPAGA